jgi:aminoglycoside phosphotransferase family enzyme
MDAAQRLAFDGEGTPVDCVVVMRRLPTEESLDVLIRSG